MNAAKEEPGVLSYYAVADKKRSFQYYDTEMYGYNCLPAAYSHSSFLKYKRNGERYGAGIELLM